MDRRNVTRVNSEKECSQRTRQVSLLRCVEENNSKRLESLLHRRVSLRLTRQDISQTLRDAISQGKHDCVPPLLAAGANPNFVSDEDGRTPLQLLLELNGHPPTIKVLIKAGADPNRPSSTASQQVPLHIAAKKGHQVCVHTLLAGGARVDRSDASGSTPLMQAARAGHHSTVGMLLREGADPNWRNLQQETALHLCASHGHTECLDDLVNAGADLNPKDAAGQTPLLLACRAGHLHAVEALHDYRCDVNAQDARDGRTVLHWAVQHGDLALVQMLLHRGAEVNVRDNDWETPFMTALNVGKIDVISLLIKAGCCVTVTDRSFNTALHVAARDGHGDIIPLLVDAGLDINLKGAGGLTPLMLGCLGGHTDVVRMLLQKDANPDVLDRHRASALIGAIMSSASEQNTLAILKMLIRANCSLDSRANALQLAKSLQLRIGRFELEDRLYSAIELAFMRGRVVAFMLLLQAGCKLRHLDLQKLLNTSANENMGQGVDLKSCKYMIKCFNHERYDIKPLKELCRRQTLSAINNLDKLPCINQLPVTEQVRRYLAYEDLDHLEETFKMAFKDKRFKSEKLNTIKETAPNNAAAATPFSRQDGRRQTYHIGNRRITSPGSSLPRARKPTEQPRSPSGSTNASPAPSPSPFKRSASLRLPRSIRRTPSNQSMDSPTSPNPKALPPKSPKAMRMSEEGTSSLRRTDSRRRFGSPDTGYSSAASSCADWSNGAAPTHSSSGDSPTGPLSRWSTQDDVFDEVPTRSRTPSESSSTSIRCSNSRIPVSKPTTPRGSRDDLQSTSRIPLPSSFTRSRSFRV